jgi:hypothetical protein
VVVLLPRQITEPGQVEHTRAEISTLFRTGLYI